MNNLKISLRWLVIQLMICLGPLSWSQTNRYLEELGKTYKAKVINDWSKENDGVLLSDSSDPRYVGVALPQYGVVYDHDFNRVNGYTTVTRIIFGKATTLKSILSLKDESKFRDARQDLPFGLKIGMARKDVEAITGQLRTIKNDEFPGIEEVYFSNLPGYRSLSLSLWFENEELTYFTIATPRNGANAYQRRLTDTDHPMKMSVKNGIAEKSITNKKLPYGSFFDGLELLFYNSEVAKAERAEPEVVRVNLHYELGADSVIHLPNEGYRVVWCTEDIRDKESFFDELLLYMNIALDSGFMNDGYKHNLIADYQQSQKNPFEYFYYHTDDGNSDSFTNKKPMFYAYQVKLTNEVVLDIYEPSRNRSSIDEPDYIGICTPENPDWALSDEQYFEKYAIDIGELQLRFGKHSGNALLRVLGRGEDFSTIGFETINGYNEKTTESWLKGIEFHFDKEFSRSVFKEELPFGFKKGMSISKIKNVLPDFEYSKGNAKKDWFTTYSGIRISANIRLSITMSFRRGKLARLVVEIDQEGAESREWKMLKSRIMPELN